jgi:hypothetical protein
MEIKPELKDGLKRAIGSTFKIHFGCVKDKDGVPIPFHLTHCELKDEFIIFDTTRQNPAYELIEKFPEVSLFLVDMDSIIKWTNPTGLQVKGLAKKEGGRFNLEIYEIYDVIPRAGIDLNIPIYRKKIIWAQTKFSKNFKFASYNFSLPQNILNEVVSIRDKAHSQGIYSVVSTIDSLTGIPNITPRWIVDVTYDAWVFGDSTRHKTQINIEKPCPTSILIFDIPSGQGILGVGWASKSDSPDLKKKVEDFWKTKGFNVPAMKVNLFHPEEIYRVSRVSFTKIFETRPRSQWLLQN